MAASKSIMGKSADLGDALFKMLSWSHFCIESKESDLTEAKGENYAHQRLGLLERGQLVTMFTVKWKK